MKWYEKQSPTWQSVHGKAWRIELEKFQEGDPRYRPSLSGYVLHMPGVHPFWSWYLLNVVSLKDMPGFEPAKKQFPEALYELSIIALNPHHEPPDPSKRFTEENPLHYLTPPNVVVQFDSVTDEQAKQIGELGVKAALSGRLPPDSDFRALWQAAVRGTIEHLTLGGHPKVSA